MGGGSISSSWGPTTGTQGATATCILALPVARLLLYKGLVEHVSDSVTTGKKPTYLQGGWLRTVSAPCDL